MGDFQVRRVTPAAVQKPICGPFCGRLRQREKHLLGGGKHRARLYAAHSFGALPRTRPKNGAPTESKFRGERRNSETNELCRKRQQREMWSL